MTRNSTTSQGEAQQTRRRFITAAGAAGATAFAGCIGDSSGGSGTQTITLAVSSGDGELIKRLLKNHVESEVGVTTETTILPNANLFEKLSTMFQSEKATYDIVAMDDPWMPQFARQLAPAGTTSTRCRPTRSFSRPSTSGPGRRPARQSRRTHGTLFRN